MSAKPIDSEVPELENQESLDINPDNDNHPHPMGTDTDVRILREQSSVFELLRKEEKGLLVLAPDFQRFSVWDKKHQSELIESILIGIPIPLIYLFEDDEGIRQIVDGKQRITALKNYFNNGFALSKLAMLPELSGKKFNDLPPVLQAKLEDYQLHCYVIQPPTPESVKFNIFERVNRSGVNLNKQEMRYALYQGKIIDLLKELAESSEFKTATGKGINNNRMRDHYVILRFIGFYLREQKSLPEAIQYNSNIDAFLSSVMKFINHQASEQLIVNIKEACLLGLKNSYEVLGAEGFRFAIKQGGQRRPINMGLFEMLVFAFSQVTITENNTLKSAAAVDDIKQEIERQNYFAGSIDTTNMVDKRFKMANELITEING